jgi:hypothetical protein
MKKNFDFECFEELPTEESDPFSFRGENGKRIPLLIKKGGPKRIIGRKIIETSRFLGSYGMGGPGFFGFKLEKKSRYPEEWIVLTLWAAIEWLLLDGKWLGCSDEYFDKSKCFFETSPSYFSEMQDLIQTPFNGFTITDFTVKNKSFKMKISNHILELPTDLSKLPPYGNGDRRKWCSGEKMENGFIISNTPYINI